jgi:hypothetical protein
MRKWEGYETRMGIHEDSAWPIRISGAKYVWKISVGELGLIGDWYQTVSMR